MTATENKTSSHKLLTRTMFYLEQQIIQVIIMIKLTMPNIC